MTGHSTCMYSSVPVCVVRQQSWLANSSWRPAHSSDNVLFEDASHCSLMTDCGGYTYFLYCYHFYSSLRMYGAMFSYNQMFCFPFIIIYSVVNSYIVNKTLKCMGAQPPEIEQHKVETKGLRKKRPGVSTTDIHQRSLHQESLRVLVSERWGGSFATSSSHSIENPLACS